MSKHENLLSPAAMEGAKGLGAKAILDDFRIDSGGTNFRTARSRKSFGMIESGILPVIVQADDKADNGVKMLGIEKLPSGAIPRNLQIYSVQVPPKVRARSWPTVM